MESTGRGEGIIKCELLVYVTVGFQVQRVNVLQRRVEQHNSTKDRLKNSQSYRNENILN